MDMEQLIEVIRCYPVLYDTTHEHYMRTKLKDELWEKIAKKLHYTDGKTAKEQWRKLRECHREAIRRQQKKGTPVRLWAYQKQMEFLQPFMKHRTKVGHLDTSAVEESQIEEDDFRLSDPLSLKMDADEPDEPIAAQAQKEVELQNDALYQFFMSMYGISKGLPIKYQRQVRRKVFEAVSQAEDDADADAQDSLQMD